MEEIKIGSHVGMAGKEMFLASVKEAERYGANVLMLYTGAPQNTRRKEIKDLNIEAGWEYATKAGIREIVVHAPYIINLANTVKPETFELAVEFLEKEIRRTAAMRSKILVLHPGSALDAGAEAGIAQTVRGLNMVLDANGDDPRFVEIPKILETPWLCAEGETKKTIPPYKEEIAQLLAK